MIRVTLLCGRVLSERALWRLLNDYSIQFEQAKCTLSGSYTVTVSNFWGISLAIQAGIVT